MADDAGPFLSYPTANETLSTFALSQSLLMINTSFLSMIESSGLFPIPDTGNSTLGVFNTTVRLTTDLEFKCLDQATVNAGVTNEVFDKTWMYEFQRSYQVESQFTNLIIFCANKSYVGSSLQLSTPILQCAMLPRPPPTHLETSLFPTSTVTLENSTMYSAPWGNLVFPSVISQISLFLGTF